MLAQRLASSSESFGAGPSRFNSASDTGWAANHSAIMFASFAVSFFAISDMQSGVLSSDQSAMLPIAKLGHNVDAGQAE